MENLRSSLDYTTHDLYELYGDKKTKVDKMYFPFAWASTDKSKFRSENIFENKKNEVKTI
jgi:hypothetical protein